MLTLPEATFSPEDVVFHYGAARVKGGKHIIFVEDDPDMFVALSKEGHDVISPYALKPKVWKHILDQPKIAISPLKSPEEGDRFRSDLAELLMGIHLTLSEWSDFGTRVLANTKHNLRHTVSDGSSLFGSMQGKPAVVCGAGPSLEKVTDIHGCMLACGSAMPLLTSRNIPFSAGVALDPHPLKEVFVQHGPYKHPLFYQNRLAPDLLDLAHGEKLLIGSRDYISRSLGLTSIDPGWNAGTFGVVLAYHLGCDPIVVVGFDGGEKLDFQMGRRFLTEFAKHHLDRTYINASDGDRIEGFEKREIPHWPGEMMPKATPLKETLSFHYIEKSLSRSIALLDRLITKRGSDPLFEVELDEEVSYKEILTPVWDVWRPIIEEDDPLKRALFLHTVAVRYKETLET